MGERIDARYAVALDAVDPWRLCDDVLSPLEVAPSGGGGWREPAGAGLTVLGAEVSSLQVVDGLVELRVFNPRDDAVTLSIPGRRGHEVDLAGRVGRPFDAELELRARGIVTLRLVAEGIEGVVAP